MTVSELGPGRSAQLASIRGSNPSIRLRLMEMGLVRGANIEVRKRAPFGGPLELRVDGYVLSVRKAEADNMLLEPTSIAHTESSATEAS